MSVLNQQLSKKPCILPPKSSTSQITTNSQSTTFSILSYNILLPNSMDGWWCYKMYSPRHAIDAEQTSWQYRSSLLQKEIETYNCDIVCFQEVCVGSFEADFAFMAELGYTHNELYKKGRFRPATFWKNDKVKLQGSVLHRDRCLVTCFSVPSPQPNIIPTTATSTDNISSEPCAEKDKYVWVANCHLQAGNTADRRFRQAFDCLEAIRKDQNRVTKIHQDLQQKQKQGFNKAKVKNNNNDKASQFNSEVTTPQFAAILVGDMNLDGHIERLQKGLLISAVEKLLVEGEVPAGFIEDGAVMTQKVKTQSVGAFTDVYAHAYTTTGSTSSLQPPPTMVVESLYGVLTSSEMIREAIEGVDSVGLWDNHVLSALGLDLVNKVFDSFANTAVTDGLVMGKEDVMKWLLKVNKFIGRGSEYRAALASMLSVSLTHQLSEALIISKVTIKSSQSESLDPVAALPSDGFISRSSFIDIYNAEIAQGKVWGVSHDLAACGFPLPVSESVFSARYDRMYMCGLEVCGVQDTGGGTSKCLPNEEHPSDHLPIWGVFEFPSS